MPKPKAPRHGSMQYWPRKRAARPYARVRHSGNGESLRGFAGYKMGMTQVQAFDSYKNSLTKNETIVLPATVLECPPLRVYSVRAYTHDAYGYKVAKEVVVAGKDKHLVRKTGVPKTQHSIEQLAGEFDDITVLVYTQPGKTGIGQKKPQLFELELGGKSAAEKLEIAKGLLGRDIKASELFKEGEYVDLHAITTGRGYQGPVKRFGIGLKPHKSEKGRRRPGSLGGWSAQQHVMYRVPMAGQMGYHQRVQYNNRILKITDKPQDVNVRGGFLRYGAGKEGNEFLLIQGSVPGPAKRMITITKALRLKKAIPAPSVEAISLKSPQMK